jgi:hypothetical protein
VNANQLFAWRRLYLQGQLEPANREAPGLLAVRVMRGASEEIAAALALWLLPSCPASKIGHRLYDQIVSHYVSFQGQTD